MPLFEYLCSACGRTSEVLQRLNEPPLTACPHCGGAVKKQISAPAFQFKGSGWYVTDYAKKGGGETAKAGAEAKSDAAAPADDGKSSSDSTTAAPSASKSETKSGAKGESASPAKSESKGGPAADS